MPFYHLIIVFLINHVFLLTVLLLLMVQVLELEQQELLPLFLAEFIALITMNIANAIIRKSKVTCKKLP